MSTEARCRMKEAVGDGVSARPPNSAGEARRRPNPCKGWPSAPASGGFGLDKGLAVAIWRCSRDRTAGTGPSIRFPRSPPPIRQQRKNARPY